MSPAGHPSWLRWVDVDAWWLVLAHVAPMLDPLCQFAGGSACVLWPVLAGGGGVGLLWVVWALLLCSDRLTD